MSIFEIILLIITIVFGAFAFLPICLYLYSYTMMAGAMDAWERRTKTKHKKQHGKETTKEA